MNVHRLLHVTLRCYLNRILSLRGNNGTDHGVLRKGNMVTVTTQLLPPRRFTLATQPSRACVTAVSDIASAHAPEQLWQAAKRTALPLLVTGHIVQELHCTRALLQERAGVPLAAIAQQLLPDIYDLTR